MSGIASTYRCMVVFTVAAVPNEIAAISGLIAPEPRISHALSAAALMSGSPTGSPVASAAAGRDLAEPFGGRDEVGQPGRVHRRHGPAPVPGLGPAERLVVERQVADLGRGRVDEPSGQALGQEPREQQVVADRRPDRGLVGAQPAGLAGRRERLDRVAQPEDPEAERRHATDASERRQAVRPPIVEPGDRGAQRPPVRVGHDDRAALGRQGDARERIPAHGRVGQDPAARLADGGPVDLGILLGPARVRRQVRRERDARRGHDRAVRPDDERAGALGPDIDRDDVIGAHPSSIREQDAAVHRPVGVQAVHGGADRGDPELALLGGEVRQVIACPRRADG